MAKSFFSANFDLIPTSRELPYDLYVNSSTLPSKNFVKIFPQGQSLERKRLVYFKKKYHQIYILEKQRGKYLNALVELDSVSSVEKGTVLKDSAIIYLDKIFDENREFSTELLNETVKGCKESVESMIKLIKNYNIAKIQTLISDLSFYDFYTYDHSINVSMYSMGIFKLLHPDATKRELTTAGLSGMLHDLGKINISTSIINNAGDLSEQELAEIKKHPDDGLALLARQKDSVDADFALIRRAVHEHHENFNGTGYPRGLRGDKIHLLARIVAVADFFDALTTKRSYQEVHSTKEALGIMANSSGRKLDPAIFELFRANIKAFTITEQGGLRLEDDFDPCQPHRNLPLKRVMPNIQIKDFDKALKKAS